MSLHSELGQGTRVDVYLPQTLSLTPHRAPDGPRTILIVEPDATVRAIACRELTHAGFNALAAKGWTEALDAVRAQAGHVDVLLIDVGIPTTDALELAVRIRRLCPTVRTLFVSQHERETLTAKGTVIDESDFLRKPFGTLELLDRLARLLNTPSG